MNVGFLNAAAGLGSSLNVAKLVTAKNEIRRMKALSQQTHK